MREMMCTLPTPSTDIPNMSLGTDNNWTHEHNPPLGKKTPVEHVVKEQDILDPPAWTWKDEKGLKELNAHMEEVLENYKAHHDEATVKIEKFEMQSERESLFDKHKLMTKEARILLKKKNKDYGGATEPYKNFRAVDFLGVHPGVAILVRMVDKISRVNTYIKNDCVGLYTDHEGVYDSLIDIINYSVLLAGLLNVGTKDDDS